LRKATKKGSSGSGTVRLQWDPHHDLDGKPMPLRRAIQLGLKGVDGFTSGADIVAITDFTDFVSTKDHINGPKEIIYPLGDDIKKILGISADPRKGGSEDDDEAGSDEEN